MKLLARREHSAQELSAKLEARGFDAADVADALGQLQSKSLQSDARFCESFVHHRVERGHGPLRIRRDLEQRGVDRDVIQAALEAADVDWAGRMRDVRRARFGAGIPRDMKERVRQMRFLQQRGFDADGIRRLFRDQD